MSDNIKVALEIWWRDMHWIHLEGSYDVTNKPSRSVKGEKNILDLLSNCRLLQNGSALWSYENISVSTDFV
jgi:hypothetical protein